MEEPGLKTVCSIFLDHFSLDGDIELLPVFTPDAIPTPLPTLAEVQKGMQFYLIKPGSGGSCGCNALSRISNPGERLK